jgi:hypothetical protein
MQFLYARKHRASALRQIVLVSLSALLLDKMVAAACASSPDRRMKQPTKIALPHPPDIPPDIKNARVVTMSFPAQSIGTLFTTRIDSRGTWIGLREIAVAKDTVTANIPPGRCLLLRCAGSILFHPEVLDALPANALDSLEITAMPLEDLEKYTGKALLTRISRLTGLQQLVLRQSPIADTELCRLIRLKKLQHLTIELCEIDGSCLQSFKDLPELSDLDISYNPLKPANLKWLVNLHKLNRLILHDCKLENSMIPVLSQCTSIEDLALNQNVHLTDAAIPSIASIKNLRCLDLKFTHITARGIRELKSLHQLRHLTISDGLVSPEQCAEIKQLFKDTTIEYASRTVQIDSDTRRIFAPLTHK